MSKRATDWRVVFLAALADVPVVGHACDAAGVHRSVAYKTRSEDEQFAKDWEDALETGVDKAEQEGFRRAVRGWEEPVIHKGVLTYRHRRFVDPEGQERWETVLDADGQPVPLTVQRHSDQLLTLILKGRRKQIYAERTEITGAEGGPVSAVDETARAARVSYLLELAKRRKDAEDLG